MFVIYDAFINTTHVDTVSRSRKIEDVLEMIQALALLRRDVLNYFLFRANFW
jgi:hypothetical protein